MENFLVVPRLAILTGKTGKLEQLERVKLPGNPSNLKMIIFGRKVVNALFERLSAIKFGAGFRGSRILEKR